MFQFRSSILSKLVVSFVAITAFAVAVIGVVEYFVAKDVVEKTVIADLQAIATIQSEQVEQLVAHSLEDLEQVRSDTQVRNTLRHLIASGDPVDRQLLLQIVADRANNSDDVEIIDIYNMVGEIVASSQPERTGRSDYDPGLQGFTFELRRDSTNALSDIHVSGPIVFDGRTIGFVILQLRGEGFTRITASHAGLRETGEITLVRRDSEGVGRFISSVRFGPTGTSSHSVSELDLGRLELAALAGSSGSESGLTDYRGERVYAVHEYIESADIGLIVKMDRSEGLSLLSENMGGFAVVVPILLLGVVVAALIVARHLVNPISRLTKSVEQFSRGHFESRVIVETSDEIGILAETFNAMALSIQKSNSELERRVESRTADLMRSNQDLEQFAYVASHDLQEPLRMVSSYTQLLSRRYTGRLDSDADEFIGYAVDGAKRMQKLINDLLTYSRVGRHDNEYKRLNVSDVVNETIENLRARMTDGEVNVVVGDLPSVVADQQQLLSLFQNLIGNAIKYRSSERPPNVRISAERTDSAWKFAVTDNGIGVDLAFSDKIFTIFQRLHGRDEYEGTGIGLAVAKKIVERAGGRIWLTSIPGEGPTFYFTVIDRIPGADTESNHERNDHRAAS